MPTLIHNNLTSDLQNNRSSSTLTKINILNQCLLNIFTFLNIPPIIFFVFISGQDILVFCILWTFNHIQWCTICKYLLKCSIHIFLTIYAMANKHIYNVALYDVCIFISNGSVSCCLDQYNLLILSLYYINKNMINMVYRKM